jgi:hypothetical protein
MDMASISKMTRYKNNQLQGAYCPDGYGIAESDQPFGKKI